MNRRPIFISSRLCAFAVLAVAFSGCAPDEKQVGFPPFDGRRAFAEVEALVVGFSPRDAGTVQGWKAAEHIRRRLRDFGVAAEIDTFVDQTPEGEKTFRNVVGRIPGRTDRWIILGSHFDTMPGIEDFQGANDSGSSTGVLLELARLLAGTKPEIGIVFAFFDGEEGIAGYVPGDGLHGSRRMAAELLASGGHRQVEAMVLLDMVGDKDLHLTVPRNSSTRLAKRVFEAARATGYRDHVSLALDMAVTDDHVPFLEIGIPALLLIDFRFGSAPGLNDYWHTSADHLGNISAESLQVSGSIAIEMVRRMAYGGGT